MAGPLVLVQEIRKLTEALNQVLQDQVGAAQTELVEHILELAKARRGGDRLAEEELNRLIGQLDEERTASVLRAISILFDLMNMAEDRHRVRVLHDRERRSGIRPRPESIGAALEQLNREGYTASQIQGFLDKLRIEPVFTAHPTEAKRRTVRSKLKNIQRCLAELDRIDLLPRQCEALERLIHSELVSLWQTDPHRPERPTVIEEVERSLFLMLTLWDVVPRLYRDLQEGLARYFPGSSFKSPRFLHFGTWIGGDRDGNPFVTSEVTARTLGMLRRAALEAQIGECRAVYGHLSMSARRAQVGLRIGKALEQALGRWPQAEERLERVSVYEIYRRWLRVVEWRLGQSLESEPFAEPLPGAYQLTEELYADIALVRDELVAHHAGAVAEIAVEDWLCRIRVFGLHMKRLDIRQESSHYAQVVDELLRSGGACARYLELSEAERQQVLGQTMGKIGCLAEEDLSERARETLALFRLLARTARLYGRDVLGAHVISMTHNPSDVLVVLWLLRWAGADAGEPELLGVGSVGIVPLFETIDDLQRAASILEAILKNPLYQKVLEGQGQVQTVMIGYSDSTKDGGYLTASWSLYQGQVELHEAAERCGVQVVFFHGRGGSLGRGGGPAARSILSLPPHTVGGAIRMTEQGEVLAARYDDPDIAFRHLEQVTAATFLVEAESEEPPAREWLETVEGLSVRAYRAYRELVQTEGFVDYFRQTTPIGEIENLPIGSRPSRRRPEKHTLESLRAIPWVFAWTQSRVLIPAWYGVGTALEEFAREDGGGWEKLERMYREWSFFRGTIDNAILALAKADMGIASAYAQLMEDAVQRQIIWEKLEAEYGRTRQAVLRMSNAGALLEDVPWLQRSIEQRDPYVDPLNLIQVELLRRTREVEGEFSERLRDLVRLSIQGVSAGMRTTG